MRVFHCYCAANTVICLFEKRCAVTVFLSTLLFSPVFNILDGLKTQISSGFLDITKTLQWTRRLADLGISGFAPIDNTLYNLETELRSAIGNLTMASTYYWTTHVKLNAAVIGRSVWTLCLFYISYKSGLGFK